jgi:hypothetical protein
MALLLEHALHELRAKRIVPGHADGLQSPDRIEGIAAIYRASPWVRL